MKKFLMILTVISFAFVGTAIAEKPDWASKKKTVKDDMKAQKKEMKAYSDDNREKKEKKTKKVKDEKMKGLEKQREKKSSQVQKELDKGSEKGQESRQQRKKWWKLWGETE